MSTVKKDHFWFLLCSACIIVFLYSSCDTPSGGWEYEFVNQTEYPVTITLSNEYKKNKEEDSSSYSTPLSLSPNSRETVYIRSDDVQFSWKADSSYIRYIYADTNGSTVTFKRR